jgi:hypothetical protein
MVRVTSHNHLTNIDNNEKQQKNFFFFFENSLFRLTLLRHPPVANVPNCESICFAFFLFCCLFQKSLLSINK